MQIWELAPDVKLVALSGRRQSTSHYYWHDHPYYELGLVLSGRCDWHLGSRRRLSLKAGEAILVKPRTTHSESIRTGDEARLAWVGFEFAGKTPEWVNRVLATGENFTEIADYIEVIAREYHRPGRFSKARVGLAAQSILLLLAHRAEEVSVPANLAVKNRSGLNPRQVNRVESAAHYFRTNLQDSLSVAQVAAYHSLCPAHFSSLFRRHHRMSPRDFLQQSRLEKAAELLLNSDGTLKEIAAQCGFVDAAHFCKSFKKAHGITPGQFRTKPVVNAQ